MDFYICLINHDFSILYIKYCGWFIFTFSSFFKKKKFNLTLLFMWYNSIQFMLNFSNMILSNETCRNTIFISKLIIPIQINNLKWKWIIDSYYSYIMSLLLHFGNFHEVSGLIFPWTVIINWEFMRLADFRI